MKRRSLHLLIGTLVVYALLVAPHEGEFWPFSIYPMFSQGGHDWSRAVVRELPEEAESPFDWAATTNEAGLPGEGFPLSRHGIDEIDLTNFVSKTERWTPERASALQHMFYDRLEGRALLVMRVNGRLEADSVEVEYVPYALLRADTTVLNPGLPR